MLSVCLIFFVKENQKKASNKDHSCGDLFSSKSENFIASFIRFYDVIAKWISDKWPPSIGKNDIKYRWLD
jgi:hypothetical protein